MNSLAIFALCLGGLVYIYYFCPIIVFKLIIFGMRFTSKFQKKMCLVDDHETHYLLRDGDKDAEVIVLLHGFGSNKDSWINFAKNIKKYKIVIPDLPGFGDSSRFKDKKYDIDTQVRRLDEFVVSLNLNKFHLAGNSMGGLISGVYAANYPEKILTLGLFDNSGVSMPHPSTALEMFRNQSNPFSITSEADFVRLRSLMFYKEISVPAPVKKVAISRALINNDFNQMVLKDLITDMTKLEGCLHKLLMPTIIIWGSEDKLIDVSCVNILSKEIKNNDLVIIEECGHAPMIEKPNLTAQKYSEFLYGNTGDDRKICS
jgi:abhydrolase domain-containing protein 6